ncbi:hypothetical protein B0H14DRAFT_2588444 [Mycena olivaceomarginata]|nr:hypothetical protein B0H14DRAFT_2588444 [Mycena olivaceomarginata]
MTGTHPVKSLNIVGAILVTPCLLNEFIFVGPPDPTGEWTWLWTGGSLMGKSVMKGTNISTDKLHIIIVVSRLMEPISPKAVNTHDRLPAAEMKQTNSMDSKMGLKPLRALKEVLEFWRLSRSLAQAFCKKNLWPTHAFIAPKSLPIGVVIWIDQDRKENKAGVLRVWPEVSCIYPWSFCSHSGNPACAITMKAKGKPCSTARALPFSPWLRGELPADLIGEPLSPGHIWGHGLLANALSWATLESSSTFSRIFAKVTKLVNEVMAQTGDGSARLRQLLSIVVTAAMIGWILAKLWALVL